MRESKLQQRFVQHVDYQTNLQSSWWHYRNISGLAASIHISLFSPVVVSDEKFTTTKAGRVAHSFSKRSLQLWPSILIVVLLASTNLSFTALFIAGISLGPSRALAGSILTLFYAESNPNPFAHSNNYPK